MSEASSNMSLLDFLYYWMESDLHEQGFDLGEFLSYGLDSFLTMFLLFFIARWIFAICVDLGRTGWK